MKKPVSLHKRIKEKIRAVKVRRRKLAEQQHQMKLRRQLRIDEMQTRDAVNVILKEAMPVKPKEGQTVESEKRKTRKRVASTAKKTGKTATGRKTNRAKEEVAR